MMYTSDIYTGGPVTHKLLNFMSWAAVFCPLCEMYICNSCQCFDNRGLCWICQVGTDEQVFISTRNCKFMLHSVSLDVTLVSDYCFFLWLWLPVTAKLRNSFTAHYVLFKILNFVVVFQRLSRNSVKSFIHLLEFRSWMLLRAPLLTFTIVRVAIGGKIKFPFWSTFLNRQYMATAGHDPWNEVVADMTWWKWLTDTISWKWQMSPNKPNYSHIYFRIFTPFNSCSEWWGGWFNLKCDANTLFIMQELERLCSCKKLRSHVC